MPYYLITSRSLTYAQRTARVLERAGITARVQRAAAQRLRAAGLPIKHVFAVDPDETLREVFL